MKLAEAFGAQGRRLMRDEDIEETLRWAIAQQTPVVIDCVVGRDANVFPMIPPGCSSEEIMLEEEM